MHTRGCRVGGPGVEQGPQAAHIDPTAGEQGSSYIGQATWKHTQTAFQAQPQGWVSPLRPTLAPCHRPLWAQLLHVDSCFKPALFPRVIFCT